jgi:hypothetical protein
MHSTPEARLRELGIELPKQLPVVGSYRLAKRHRDIVYVAGHVSARLDLTDLIRGKVGADLTLDQAQEAARICALHMLATLRTEIGSLHQVVTILKVFGMINGDSCSSGGDLGGPLWLVVDVMGAGLARRSLPDSGAEARVKRPNCLEARGLRAERAGLAAA